MLSQFFNFVNTYGSQFKWRIVLVLIFAALASSLEIMGIAMLYPLISLVVRPEAVTESKTLSYGYKLLNLTSVQSYVIVIAFCIGALFVFKNAYMVLQQSYQFNLIKEWRDSLCNQLMKHYITAPLTFHLKNDSAALISNLTSVINHALNSFLVQCVLLVSNIIVACSLLGILLYLYPFVAMGSGLLVGGLIWLQILMIRRASASVNAEYVEINKKTYSLLITALAGVKDTKLTRKEDYFIQNYSDANSKVSLCNKKIMLLQYAPIYITEAVLMIGIIAFIIYILAFSAPEKSIASIAVLAATAIRFAPLANRILYSYSQIKSSQNALSEVETQFKTFVSSKPDIAEPISFNQHIEFSGVNFRYDKKLDSGITNACFKLRKGETVGIVGSSGAGKTTFADVLAGLLPINDGEIFVDGAPIPPARYKGMRYNVSYVSQSPFLLNASIRENIAFGFPKDQINDQKVWAAIRDANLTELAEERGLSFILGEHGKRLSGGQRQRIAIARALYFDRELIIFDEATSALDVTTEYEVTQTLLSLRGVKTIIVIAHRLSTLKELDRLVMMDHGKIIADSSFKKLYQLNGDFRTMVDKSGVAHAS